MTTGQATETGAGVPKHPDLFTPEEAAVYLHLDSPRGLETLRSDFGLIAHRGVNKAFIYHREDLDLCAARICGKDREWASQQGHTLKIAGRRA